MMKFLYGFLSAVVMALAATATMAQAGLFDSAMTSGWASKSTTAQYKLETYGYNVRVYEWAPKDDANTRCVFVAGNENSSGVACYKMEEMK